jgi:hypothetical protein
MTSAGVGVGIGKPRVPDPGTSEADRRSMEMDSGKKACRKGMPWRPSTVYLYFAVPQKSK